MIVVSARSMEEAKNNKADIVEFRFDLFSSLPEHKEIKAIEKPKIITIRKPEDGGKFIGDEEERLNIFRSYSELFDYADIEVYAKDEFFELPCSIIESYHNFNKTPSFDELKDMVENKRGNIFKIAVMGREKKDVATITKILSEYDNVVAFLMGEKFSFTRIMSLFMGSPFIYCSIGKAVAPGQLSVDDVRAILDILS